MDLRPVHQPGEIGLISRPRLRALPPGAWSWRVFLTCWLVYAFFWTPFIVREHFPALALAERGSLNVERYFGWTEDIFRGSNGGAYINNNPGASLTGAIPLLLFKPLLARVDAWNQTLPRPGEADEGEMFQRTLQEGRGIYFLLVAFLTSALIMGPATAATAGYLCSRLIQSGVPGSSATLCALVYGLGTPVLFRIGHLNHNLLVGNAGFLALLLLWDPEDRLLTALRAMLAGLLAGYSVLCDYSGVVVVAITALYVWLRSSQQTGRARFRILAAFAAGLAPAFAALALYQAWAFGSLYRPSQHYMAPTAPTSHGYRGFDWPSPSLAWANFFDPRFGLFLWCPALILAFWAPFQRSARYRLPRRETWVILTYFSLFVLFCAANQYSWLQPSTGFRYLVPIVGPMAVLAIQASQSLGKQLRRMLALLTCVQAMVVAAAQKNDVRLSLGTLWGRRFEMLWMIRLAKAGVPASQWWSLSAFVLLTVLLVLLWYPSLRQRHAIK
ncbi:MAG: hypothetical protein M3N54_14240 [Acidobacteriota bacterium]|nr:hypothetical protein [Acidobacteriota bacterium]